MKYDFSNHSEEFWNRDSHQISRETGVSVRTVQLKRKTYAPETIGQFRKKNSGYTMSEKARAARSKGGKSKKKRT